MKLEEWRTEERKHLSYLSHTSEWSVDSIKHTKPEINWLWPSPKLEQVVHGSLKNRDCIIYSNALEAQRSERQSIDGGVTARSPNCLRYREKSNVGERKDR